MKRRGCRKQREQDRDLLTSLPLAGLAGACAR